MISCKVCEKKYQEETFLKDEKGPLYYKGSINAPLAAEYWFCSPICATKWYEEHDKKL